MVIIISREKTKGRERKGGRRLSKGLCRTHYDVRKEITSRTVQFTTRHLINLTGKSHERGNLSSRDRSLCPKPTFVLDLQKARIESLHRRPFLLGTPSSSCCGLTTWHSTLHRSSIQCWELMWRKSKWQGRDGTDEKEQPGTRFYPERVDINMI